MATTRTKKTSPPTIFPKIALGKDTTGLFVLSTTGVAVRTEDGDIGFDGDSLVNVSGMAFDGGIFFRMPTQEVAKGDLIIMSDADAIANAEPDEKESEREIRPNEISLLFVREIRSSKSISGLNPVTHRSQRFEPPRSGLMGKESKPIFIKIVSPFAKMLQNMGAGDDMEKFLPLMMMGQGGDLTQVLMMQQMMGGKGGDDFSSMLPLLLMNQGKNDDDGGNGMSSLMSVMMMGMFAKKSGTGEPSK